MNRQVKSALSDYMKSLYDIPVLTREEEAKLSNQFHKHGDELALEKLITHNLRFVVLVIKENPHWEHSNVPMEDMLGFGNEALVYAARKWKPQGDIKFATYARKFITLGVNRGVANTRNIIRLPVNVMEEIRRYRYKERILTQKLGREPTFKEVADEMEVSVDTITKINTILNKEPISLDSFDSDHVKDENNDN